MSDLVEFLRARLDEDEQRARRAATQWDDEDVRYEWEDLPDDVFTHARIHDPARVLAEVEAKRRILDLEICLACHVEAQPCDHRGATLRLLALPYADHPDYREEWRP